MPPIPQTSQALLALSTCPNLEVARSLADALVERRLAACVNIVPGVESVYRWQGKIAHDRELLLVIKTQSKTLDALRQCLRELHPYEVPELITFTISDGLEEYLNWITTSMEGSS